MKQVQKFAYAMLALAAIGCGGSGNGTSTTASTVTTSTPRIEAIVKVLPTNLLHPSQWTAAQLLNPQTPGLQADLINPNVFGVQDPNNFQAGEQYVFQLVSYTTTAAGVVRNILSNVSFASTDPTNLYGNLANNTGDFSAGTNKTTSTLSVTAESKNSNYMASYSIQTDQVRLIGTVLAQGTNANQLAGTKLNFYDGTGLLVGSVTVEYDGTFRASVPTTATGFTVVADSVPGTFYQSYNYLSTQYDAGVSGCDGTATLPVGLTVGTATLAGPVYVAPKVANQGPPPSTGCLAIDTVREKKKI